MFVGHSAQSARSYAVDRFKSLTLEDAGGLWSLTKISVMGTRRRNALGGREIEWKWSRANICSDIDIEGCRKSHDLYCDHKLKMLHAYFITCTCYLILEILY